MTDIQKKYITISAIVIALLIVGGLVYFALSVTKPSGSLEMANFPGADKKTATDGVMYWKTPTGEVKMNNIFSGHDYAAGQDIAILTTVDFEASYRYSGDFIEVTLQTEPYSSSLLKAQTALVQLLGAGSDICKLPIEVYSKDSVEDQFRPDSGVDYGLPMCSRTIN